jgi:hypothetical protein
MVSWVVVGAVPLPAQQVRRAAQVRVPGRDERAQLLFHVPHPHSSSPGQLISPE